MIKAKKSLGQNFLIDKNIISKITNTVNIKGKSVLEVGPGTGNLTSSILKKLPKKLYVVEKDNKLFSLLSKEYENKIVMLNEDILKLDENLLCDDQLIVFGNLPYNISTEILCKWIYNINDEKLWFSNLILMFQKEVANRIVSNFNSSNYGRLSVISNWKMYIKKICDINPESFSPRPKVDSSLLFFSPKKDFFKLKDPRNLEKITRIFFSHRRKIIKKPFNIVFNGNIDIANKLKIDLNLRPQNLDFETYYKLTNEYEKLRC